MAAYEILLLNTAIPQIQAAQSGDTYVVPRDIAFSAALTLSAGTANGVPYLNGSKVLTTGSALTFNGTNAFVFGDGSSSSFTAVRSSNGNTFTIRSGSGTDSALVLSGDSTTASNFVALKAWNSSSYNEIGVYGNGSSGYAYFNLSGSERARITSGGDLLVGQTLRGLRDSNSFDFDVTDSSAYINHVTGSASGSTYVYFGYAAGAIGSISQNGTTGVLYNITSDYRLKNVVGAVTGAGARIDALKPVDYTWKTDGSAARGFLAHEFQAVYPNSVIGTKDAVDEEGKPIHQQMQASTSEVIADLVAELQSLRARVAQLEAK